MPQRRFLVVGLPRSGTTYLATLLNSHRDILCSGELFNPQAIVSIGGLDSDYEALLARDAMPLRFMAKFFADVDPEPRAVGFKYMIGHHVRLLRKLADDPDLALIYVWRENKLAQISSLIKAARSKAWAQKRENAHVQAKISVDVRNLTQRWHEYETYDYLFSQVFETLPNPRLKVEYRELFAADFNARIIEFLGVEPDLKMSSKLVKQSANTVLERFENPGPVERYFRLVGYERWLGAEL